MVRKQSIMGSFRVRVMAGVIALSTFGLFLQSCESEQKNDEQTEVNSGEENKTEDNGKGIGPVKDVEIPAAIDQNMAAEGKAIFEAKCTACHNATDQKKVGPGQLGVTKRRKPEWIMNMILNPSEMTQKDPTAHELLATYIAQMANQNLTQDEARKVYEYFRKNDADNLK